jgi:hypothetical protein
VLSQPRGESNRKCAEAPRKGMDLTQNFGRCRLRARALAGIPSVQDLTQASCNRSINEPKTQRPAPAPTQKRAVEMGQGNVSRFTLFKEKRG